MTLPPVAQILRSLMQEIKTSEADLARSTNIPQATINKILQGLTQDPRASTLVAIAQALNVTVGQLVGTEPRQRGQNLSTAVKKEKLIRVLLADDHPLVLTGFTMALLEHDIDVAGQADSLEDVMAQYRSLSPDILVLDIRFGEDLSGLETAKQVLHRYQKAKVVFLSQFDQDFLIKEAYKLGARAFITKDCTPAELAAILKRVHAGELCFLPNIAERLASLVIQGENT